ncbi:MAG: hypothetical protein M1827_001783 [Pycnora praestabilis]|nr:MAG: hypothetical protein M1827_001783 [Pycnora praestabilis]
MAFDIHDKARPYYGAGAANVVKHCWKIRTQSAYVTLDVLVEGYVETDFKHLSSLNLELKMQHYLIGGAR